MATAYNSPCRNRCWRLGWVEATGRLVEKLVVPLLWRRLEPVDVAVGMLCFFVLSITRIAMLAGLAVEGRLSQRIYLCAPSRHHSPISHKVVLDGCGFDLPTAATAQFLLPQTNTPYVTCFQIRAVTTGLYLLTLSRLDRGSSPIFARQHVWIRRATTTTTTVWARRSKQVTKRQTRSGL